MKALTICQPYAHLIVVGDKRVENRGWETQYRGPLVIHAGKSRSWLAPGDDRHFARTGDPLVFGAVLGVVQLVDVLHIDPIERGDYDARFPWLREHHHTSGEWCWVLEDERRLKTPIPYKGSQRLWNFDESLLLDFN